MSSTLKDTMPDELATSRKDASSSLSTTRTRSNDSLYRAHLRCCNEIEALSAAISQPVRTFDGQPSSKDIQDTYDKYSIWANNVGAGYFGRLYELSLDYRLREASEFSTQVEKLLISFQSTLQSIADLINGNRTPFEETSHKAFSDNGDSDLDHSPTSESDESSSDTSSWGQSSHELDAEHRSTEICSPATTSNRMTQMHYSVSIAGNGDRVRSLRTTGSLSQLEMPYLWQSIQYTITCLYRLPLRQAASFDRLKNEASLEFSSYQHFDVMHVKESFRGLDENIAIRLGKSNTRRRQLLGYRYAHDKRTKAAINSTVTNTMHDKLLSDVEGGFKTQESVHSDHLPRSTIASSQRTLQTRATTVRPEKDTLLPPENLRIQRAGYAESQATAASSYVETEMKLSIPSRPLSDSGLELTHFECPYCYTIQNIELNHKWKKHVLQDLKPYVCTFAHCELYDHFFDSKDEWYTHEATSHRVQWWCNDSDHTEFDSIEDFHNHMASAHGTEMAKSTLTLELFRLPPNKPGGVCNLCFRECKNLKSHVSRHLEILALFALPRTTFSSGSNKAVANIAVSASTSNKLREDITEISQEQTNTTDSPVFIDDVSTRLKAEVVAIEEVPDTINFDWDVYTSKYMKARLGESELAPINRTISSPSPKSFQARGDEVPESVHANELRKIDEALSFPHFLDPLNHHQSTMVEGTCLWIFDNPTYKEWASKSGPQNSNFLLLHGNSGHGKTILCAKIIQMLNEDPDISVYHFFASTVYQQRSSIGDILRYWISQMVRQNLEMSDFVWQRLRTNRFPSVLSSLDITLIFSELLSRHGGCVFVLDGFDECDPAGRRMYQETLKSSIEGTTHKLLITSCTEFGLGIFSQASTLLQCDIGQHTYQDLVTYSASIVKQKLNLHNDSTRQAIAKLLVQGSSGSFLWIFLASEVIYESKSDHDTIKHLRNLDSSLDLLCDRLREEMMQRLDLQAVDRALKLLRWCSFAFRPLHISELIEAIDATPSEGEELHDNTISAQSIDQASIAGDLEKLCRPFITILHPDFGISVYEGTVHLIHDRMREYVSNTLPVRREGMENSAFQHLVLSKACLRYLCLRNVGQNSTLLNVDRDFRQYALEYWVAHKTATDTADDEFYELATRFLTKSSLSYKEWAMAFERSSTTNLSNHGDQDYEYEPAMPLYYASLMDLLPTMEAIYHHGDSSLDSVGGRYGTALQAACVYDSLDAFDLLLNWGANVNITGGAFGSALHASVALGRFKMMKDLLHRGAMLNLVDENIRTPLHLAAKSRRLEMARLLLAHGADIQALSRDGWSPLHLAVRHGNLEIARLLLAQGADIRALSRDGWSPLHLAAKHGRLGVARLLLAHGADVQALSRDGWTVLHVASHYGFEALVQLFIDHGSDVNCRTLLGETALVLATRWKCKGVIECLLSYGVELNSLDETGKMS